MYRVYRCTKVIHSEKMRTFARTENIFPQDSFHRLTHVTIYIFACFSALCATSTHAQQNNTSPASCPGRTLRVDYDFSGNTHAQHIAVAGLSSFSGWAGRRVHTDSVPLRGNGDITLRDLHTGRVLYCQSFSTLFQEWLTTEEATHTSRSFENTFCCQCQPTRPR